MEDFIIRALIAGTGIAVLSGPLGCLVVWQRMAYFGAALSHAALLGIALGFFFSLDLKLAMLLIMILCSLMLMLLSRFQQFSSDTLLGVLAHVSLALGIVVISLVPGIRVDLMAYLFGDILSVSLGDIVWIYGGGSIALIVLALIWRPILALTLNRELALVDGINESRTRFIFLILLSFVVAISMQLVGVLLIVSLLIIPPATARIFSRSPEQMAFLAILVGFMSVALGLWASLMFDTPAGPGVVLASGLLFSLALLKRSS